jgi:hypothetical protein
MIYIGASWSGELLKLKGSLIFMSFFSIMFLANKKMLGETRIFHAKQTKTPLNWGKIRHGSVEYPA